MGGDSAGGGAPPLGERGIGEGTESFVGGQPLERRFSIASGVGLGGRERGQSLRENGVVVHGDKV